MNICNFANIISYCLGMELFLTMVFVNGRNLYYRVKRDGAIYVWEPAPNYNAGELLCLFNMYRRDGTWKAEVLHNKERFNEPLFQQAVVDIYAYYSEK